MNDIKSELRKKKKNVKRSRQGNNAKQSIKANPDKQTSYNKYLGQAQDYKAIEHITNDDRITIDT